MTPVILAGELPDSGGGIASAAAVAVALSSAPESPDDGEGAAVVVEVGGRVRRGPTMLASERARGLERTLRGAGFDAAARGRLVWVALEHEAGEAGWRERLHACVEASAAARAVVVFAPVELWRPALADSSLEISAALLRAELPEQRALAALAARELRADGLRVRITARAPGRVASRRALAGIDPGGEAGRRAARIARGLQQQHQHQHRSPDPPAATLIAQDGLEPDHGLARAPARPAGGRVLAESGQSLPLVLGSVALLICATLALTAFGGAVTGKSRAQRSADLAALSAARSMRDDFDRLFVAARRPNGVPNPAHLSKAEYLARAEAAAIESATRNDVAPQQLEVAFPDAESFAPLRVRAELVARVDLGPGGDEVASPVHAEAEAVPASPTAGPGGDDQRPATATGGGYSGPLVYRQGKPMRPDVGAAFDELEAAARREGVALLINSAFRSDAEQAVLWAANPDPRWVAPPGTSLHRCATELDLGPSAAYAWLAVNAPRFGFVKRYSWEDWHFGFDAGPAPCSAQAQTQARRGDSGDGAAAEAGLPSFVPARFRDLIAAAATRWNVSATLLSAQLMAESNFNPFAVSGAGAQGIAQFMPATAAAYGLEDPFDPAQAIDAQTRLMAELLDDFGGEVSLALAAYNAGPGAVSACSCVPSYPETQAYVARILGLMDRAGEVAAPTLEIRLVD